MAAQKLTATETTAAHAKLASMGASPKTCQDITDFLTTWGLTPTQIMAVIAEIWNWVQTGNFTLATAWAEILKIIAIFMTAPAPAPVVVP